MNPSPPLSVAQHDADTPRHWHIFCRVVDNFGDIGVCWRLARQLHQQHGRAVTLWVDDLTSFQAITPAISADCALQVCDGVQVRHWVDPLPALAPADVGDVVIEAFACELPASYVRAMQVRRPLWLNLEYLSAEPWVRECHRAPSPRLGLQKFFFFPGFTPGTGGLLWDPALERLRQQPRDHAALQHLLAELGVALPESVTADPEPLRISLFGYENPALAGLLSALSQLPRPVHMLVPAGRIRPDVNRWLGAVLAEGASARRGALTLTALPFMTQLQYDALLAVCDLNFVRGEESFGRSQMLGRPLIWHIYPQEEGAHLDKLQAFLDLYVAALPAPQAALVRGWYQGWNAVPGAPEPVWSALPETLPEWQLHAQSWREKLLEAGDLALNLVTFSKNPV